MTRVTITRKVRVTDPTALDPWVPEPGTFANIGTHTMKQLLPTLTDTKGPFANWTGGDLAADYGNSGAFVIHGSGHLADGTELPCGVWVFDLESQLWARRCVNVNPNYENYTTPGYDEYGQFPGGSPYPAHCYNGLVYQPSAHGGGSDGSLIRMPAPVGNVPHQVVFRFDLSEATEVGVSRIVSDMSVTGPGSQAVWDSLRGGWWCMQYGGKSPLVFLSASDFSETVYPSISFASYYHDLVYLPEHDALVSMGQTQYGVGGFDIRVLKLSPMGANFSLCTMSGTPPTNGGCGGVWSTLLNRIVSYPGIAFENLSPGYTVFKCEVPTDVLNGTWQWTSETLTSADGSVPAHATDSNGDAYNNGSFGRFVEAPNNRCFLWAASVNKPLQAWRLTGM